MRPLLDEHFDYVIAEQLRQRGIDCASVTQDHPELVGQDDDVVFRSATRERRVVITNNVRDFAPLVEKFGLDGETHYGVVFTDDETFPRTNAGIGRLVATIEKLVRGKPEDWLLDSCIYLEP